MVDTFGNCKKKTPNWHLENVKRNLHLDLENMYLIYSASVNCNDIKQMIHNIGVVYYIVHRGERHNLSIASSGVHSFFNFLRQL